MSICTGVEIADLAVAAVAVLAVAAVAAVAVAVAVFAALVCLAELSPARVAPFGAADFSSCSLPDTRCSSVWVWLEAMRVAVLRSTVPRLRSRLRTPASRVYSAMIVRRMSSEIETSSSRRPLRSRWRGHK